jgi:hypothetical protein
MCSRRNFALPTNSPRCHSDRFSTRSSRDREYHRKVVWAINRACLGVRDAEICMDVFVTYIRLLRIPIGGDTGVCTGTIVTITRRRRSIPRCYSDIQCRRFVSAPVLTLLLLCPTSSNAVHKIVSQTYHGAHT